MFSSPNDGSRLRHKQEELLMSPSEHFSFGNETEGYVHAHRHSQVSHVVEGEFHVNVDGVIKILKAGDSFFVPPHVDHGAVCPTGGILIDVFSPPREDFVEGLDAPV